jgi:hypothetical protein
MFDPERLYRSWALTDASLKVLRANRQLMVFPVVASILSVAVAIPFMLPALLQGFLIRDMHFSLHWLRLFAYLVLQYAVIFFADSALIGAAILCLRGRPASVAEGFRLAANQIGSILGYAVIATTLGRLLRGQRRRAGALGRLILDLGDMAWKLATFLVAPVLIAEKLGPIDAIKRSAELLKKTWGEQIIGNVGINTLFSWIALMALVPFVALAYFCYQHDYELLSVVVILLLFLVWSILSVVYTTLQGIFTAAVYLYAADDLIADPFDSDLIQDTFRSR